MSDTVKIFWLLFIGIPVFLKCGMWWIDVIDGVFLLFWRAGRGQSGD